MVLRLNGRFVQHLDGGGDSTQLLDNIEHSGFRQLESEHAGIGLHQLSIDRLNANAALTPFNLARDRPSDATVSLQRMTLERQAACVLRSRLHARRLYPNPG